VIQILFRCTKINDL